MIQLKTKWLDAKIADALLSETQALPLEQRFLQIKGMSIPMPRLTGWCNDFNFGYRYSGQETPVMAWPLRLHLIRRNLEEVANKKLPAVLINYYRDQNDSVGWHKDNEKWFKNDPFIVSLSCGASRMFKMRNPTTKEKLEVLLGHGDVLIFTEEHVLEWEHTLVKSNEPSLPRANFTFRTIQT